MQRHVGQHAIGDEATRSVAAYQNELIESNETEVMNYIGERAGAMGSLRRLAAAACMGGLAVLLVGVGTAAADTTTGFLVLNPWLDDTSGDPLFDDPDGVFWTIDPEWEFEPFVFDGALMFPTKATNLIQTNTARASTVDLTTQPNVTALPGYDPNTTELTGVTFADPWRVGNFGAVAQDGQYDYWIEFTIETSGGDYKAATQKLDRATTFQNTIAQLGFVFSWVSDASFGGDPFSGGGGLALNSITNMHYDVIIETIVPTTTIDQFGDTGFFNVEGFNVEYEVSSASGGSPADLDGDGDVDVADALAIQRAGGAYGDWDNDFGMGAGGPIVGAVPEPTALTLLMVLGISGAGFRYRK